MKRVSKTIFTCDKCAKEIEYSTRDEYDDNFDFKANECWEIRLGRAGYGSSFDGSEVNFDLCDSCLYEFVNSFYKEGKERVHNSGSNAWYGDEDDWEDEEE